MLKRLEGMLKKRAERATADFRNHVRHVRSRLPPLRIELVPSADRSWIDIPSVRDVVCFLKDSGFQNAGVMAVKGNDQAAIAGFAATQHAAYASIPRAGDRAFVMFESHFTDGTAFACTNMPVPVEPPCPDWLVRRWRTGASVQELWTYFLATRPTKHMENATAEGFAASNANDVFREQAWMAERGGATQDELAARYKAIGKLPEGAARESFLNMARSDEIERSLCNWWRLQSNAPFPFEQVVDPLVIIHDEMSLDLLINAYWCATDDFKAKDADFAQGTPRDSFARVVINRSARLRRVFQKRTPLEADFYLPE